MSILYNGHVINSSSKILTAMNWGIADAKQRFSELIQATLQEPQPIYKRNQLVAFVVEASLFQEFLRWRHQQKHKSIATAFAELREACAEEDIDFETPTRVNRQNAFFEDHVSF
jgi:pantothenate kinase-related protein Tda10